MVIPTTFKQLFSVALSPVCCATIEYSDGTTLDLIENYTDEEFCKFLIQFDLKIIHDVSIIRGTVWFEDDSWSERIDVSYYDNKDWEYYFYPKIPDHLKSNVLG